MLVRKALAIWPSLVLPVLFMVELTHWYAGRAVQGGAIEDGGGADDQAEHYQPVDHKVLQGVPPEGGLLNAFVLLSIERILPWPEHLLCISVAHEGAQEGGAKGCHCHQISSQLNQMWSGVVGKLLVGPILVWSLFSWFGGVAVGHWGKLGPTWWSGGPMEVAPIHDQTCHQQGILTLKCYQCDFLI